MNQLYFDKMIELYKLNLENQHNQYNLLITVIIGIFIALLGFNWYWNKQKIEGKITEIETKFTTIKDEIKSEYEIFFKIKEKEISNRLQKHEGALATLSTMTFDAMGDYSTAIFFCCRSIGYINFEENSESPEALLMGVNMLLKFIQHPDVIRDKKIVNLEESKRIIRKLPTLLNDKKKIIMEFLDQCTNVPV